MSGRNQVMNASKLTDEDKHGAAPSHAKCGPTERPHGSGEFPAKNTVVNCMRLERCVGGGEGRRVPHDPPHTQSGGPRSTRFLHGVPWVISLVYSICKLLRYS